MREFRVIQRFSGGLLPPEKKIIIVEFYESLKNLIPILGVEKISSGYRCRANEYIVERNQRDQKIDRVRTKNQVFINARVLYPFVDRNGNETSWYVERVIETAQKHDIDLLKSYTENFLKTKKYRNIDALELFDGRKVWQFFKNTHHGGISWSTKGKVENVSAVDGNGMYLSILIGNLPTGKIRAVENEKIPKDNFAILNVTLTVGNPRFKDFLPLKNWGIINHQKCTVDINSIDLELIKKWYYVEKVKVNYGFEFEMQPSIFANDLVKFAELRNSDDEIERKIGKNVPNIISGLFGKIPISEKILGNGEVYYYINECGQTNGIHIASFIASECRRKIAIAIDGRENDIVRINTDGIHYVGNDLPNAKISKKIGDFKKEFEYAKIRYWGPSTYVGRTSDGEGIGKFTGMILTESERKEIMEEIGRGTINI